MYLKIKKVEKDFDLETGEILGFTVLISYKRYNTIYERWYDIWMDNNGDYLVDFNGLYQEENDDYLLERTETIVGAILACL